MIRIAILLAACGNGLPCSPCDGGPVDSGTDAGIADAGSDAGRALDAGRDGGASGCETITFDHDGVMRLYTLCVPDPLPAGDLPVVLGFHGGGGNAGTWQRTLPWHETGAREGFVVVYMQGCREGETDCSPLDGSYLWNIGKPGETSAVDDQGFTLAVLDRLASVHGLSVDAARIFATGHSLGGMFTYTLRCDQPDLFAAIGPVSATPSDGTCTLAGDTSIYHVHGTADANVPFDTGCCSRAQQTAGDPEYLAGCDALPRCFNPVNWWPPVRTGVHPYADLAGLEEIAQAGLGCSTARAAIDGLPGCEAYQACPAGIHVEECLVSGAPHALGMIDAAFDVRAYLWSRFAAH